MIEVVREWADVIKTGGLVVFLVVLAAVCVYLEGQRKALLVIIATLQEQRVRDAVDNARASGETNAKTVAVLSAVHETLQRRRSA